MRVRFAPSPTGALHIGGARTALYNWLLARGSGGTLVLRIEDTDRERSTPENVEQILDALRWLELDFDEGPISQSAQRRAPPGGRSQQLLDAGHAYRSTATADDVRAFKEATAPTAASAASDEGEGAVRLRVPDEGATVVHDVIRGDTHLRARPPRRPRDRPRGRHALYNFAVAVDDLDARITHVVRGEDHSPTRPSSCSSSRRSAREPPVYAHLPLLHGPDGKKLSKRHGAASVQELRDAGYLPEAVRNYLALLGWGDDDDETILTTDELVERFALERVSQAPAGSTSRSCAGMNGRYLRELSVDELTRAPGGVHRPQRPARRRRDLAARRCRRSRTSGRWRASSSTGRSTTRPRARSGSDAEGARPRCATAREALAARRAVGRGAARGGAARAWSSATGVKPKQVFQPMRVALAGTTVSPGIFETRRAARARRDRCARIDARCCNA